MADSDRPHEGFVHNLDARSLRALAHPLRVRILNLLSVEGPTTSARLAERLRVKSGSTSWHLSKLAEHGLIEEDADRGTQRERWWRATSPTWSVDAARFLGDPEVADDTAALLAAVIHEQCQRSLQFLSEDWSSSWRHSWILESSIPLRLSPDELEALRDDLHEVIARYRRDATDAPDRETVVLQMQGFPVRRASR